MDFLLNSNYHGGKGLCWHMKAKMEFAGLECSISSSSHAGLKNLTCGAHVSHILQEKKTPSIPQRHCYLDSQKAPSRMSILKLLSFFLWIQKSVMLPSQIGSESVKDLFLQALPGARCLNAVIQQWCTFGWGVVPAFNTAGFSSQCKPASFIHLSPDTPRQYSCLKNNNNKKQPHTYLSANKQYLPSFYISLAIVAGEGNVDVSWLGARERKPWTTLIGYGVIVNGHQMKKSNL